MSLTEAEARAVLDGLGEAAFTAGPEGLVTSWSDSAARIYGFTAREVTGRPLTWLLADGVDLELEELATLPVAPTIDLLGAVRRRHGAPLRSAVSLARLPGGHGVAGTARPVTGWLEGGLSRRDDWERALGRLVRELSALEPGAHDRTDALARALMDQGHRMLPDTEAMLCLVPAADQSEIEVAAAAGPWASTLAGRRWPRDGTLSGRTMAVRRTLETARIDIAAGSRAVDAGGMRAARLTPLWTKTPLPDGRDAIGVLAFYRAEARYFSPRERRLIEQLARFASLGLQRTELSESAHRATASLRVGVETAHDLSRSLDEGEIAERLIQRAREAVACDRAVVLTVEASQATVVSVRSRQASAVVGRRFSVAAPVDASGEPILLRAVETLRPVRTAGYRITGFTDADNRFLESMAHTVVVPLAVSGTAVGALVVGRLAGPDFTDDELALLRTVGNLAALAIRNASLYARVEEAARVKSDFLNMAAHELRTPLTVIRGYLSMMRDGSFGDLGPELVRPVEILATKTDELGRLVDDLLVAARIDTDRLLVSRQPVDLNEAAATALARARSRSLEVAADVRLRRARRPVVVNADPTHLERVLDGLVSNALNYGGRPPRVDLRVDSEHGAGVLSVTDRGPGIPAAERDRVFERFYRFDAGTDPLAPGTGLGLYIARGLTAAMGGRLTLDETPGGGATFRLVLEEYAGQGAGD